MHNRGTGTTEGWLTPQKMEFAGRVWLYYGSILPPIDRYVESCCGDRVSSCRLLIDFDFHSNIFTAFNRRVAKAIAEGCQVLHTIIHTFITPSYIRAAPGSEGSTFGKLGRAAVEAG